MSGSYGAKGWSPGWSFADTPNDLAARDCGLHWSEVGTPHRCTLVRDHDGPHRCHCGTERGLA